jgi:Tol biopolymer transport system component
VLRGNDGAQRLYVARNLAGVAVVCSSHLKVLPSSVAWAYGGKSLSFSGSGDPRRGYRLFLQRSAGQLPAQQVQLPGYLDADPAAWSPDGHWLAWHAGPRSQPSRGHLYLASTEAPSDAESLTRGLAGGLEPRFSADGKWLSYTAVHDFEPMRSTVVLVDPWHREERREIDLGQVTSGAVLSSDGSKVAVLAGEPSHLRLYVEEL